VAYEQVVTVVVAGYLPHVTTTVQDNPAEKRYEATVDGELAGFATYHLSGPKITLIHTEVDDAYEGQGIAKLLAEHILDAARDAGLQVIPKCPFMSKYIRETREYVDLVPEARRAEFGLDEAAS
jgi:predicted GNAT family acetyltransferase